MTKEKQDVRIGPAGIGSAKDAQYTLDEYRQRGIKAAEIPFTYKVWMNNEQAKAIGNEARKNDVILSIHAQYWINLNSEEKQKIEASKKRILECCEVGHYLGAKYIVFHAAFYGNNGKKKVYVAVKKAIIEMQKIIKKNKWQVALAPETTGKASQFGDLDELIKLNKETGCFFCVDFAHLKARYNGKINYKEIFEKLKKFSRLHAHFSGIEFTEKGERRHIITGDEKWRELLKWIKRYNMSITIINESPDPVNDSLKGVRIWKSISK